MTKPRLVNHALRSALYKGRIVQPGRETPCFVLFPSNFLRNAVPFLLQIDQSFERYAYFDSFENIARGRFQRGKGLVRYDLFDASKPLDLLLIRFKQFAVVFAASNVEFQTALCRDVHLGANVSDL